MYFIKKNILYVGLDAPTRDDATIIHCPLIEVVPIVQPEVDKALLCSHIIMTSKTAVRLFFSALQDPTLLQKSYLAVGKATAKALASFGVRDLHVACDECQEGLIELIESLPLDAPAFFWGHSSHSRPLLKRYLEKKNCPFYECVLYETCFKAPPEGINLKTVDEIFFSSPSTVKAFFHYFGRPPDSALLLTQGRVTKQCLDAQLQIS